MTKRNACIAKDLLTRITLPYSRMLRMFRTYFFFFSFFHKIGAINQAAFSGDFFSHKDTKTQRGGFYARSAYAFFFLRAPSRTSRLTFFFTQRSQRSQRLPHPIRFILSKVEMSPITFLFCRRQNFLFLSVCSV